MEKRQSRVKLIVTIIILAATLLIVSGFALWQNTSPNDSVDVSNQPVPETKPAESTEKDTETTPAAPETTVIDPATLKSLPIDPLGIVVTYDKSLPGFEYAIQRSADGTQYVEFTSPDLKGTKCTDDQGLFVSIIKNPGSSYDGNSLDKTTQVGSDTYGLSLAGQSCTKDIALLKKYQKSFSENFATLKAI